MCDESSSVQEMGTRWTWLGVSFGLGDFSCFSLCELSILFLPLAFLRSLVEALQSMHIFLGLLTSQWIVRVQVLCSQNRKSNWPI